MGQQQLVLLALLLSAVLLPQTLAAGAGQQGPNVAAMLNSMRDPAALSTAAAYQKLMSHKHTLSEGHLERSLAFTGANLRLRRLLKQLMKPERQHFHVGVIGGSISWGHGVQRGSEDWFSLLQRWMQETFPQHNITFKNGCVPATQSSYVSSCLQQFVDADVDLVFVEYATNDGYSHGSVENSLVQSFERLLRKLLAFRRAPAVVLQQFLATDVMGSKLPFWATGEDQYGILAQYYSIPCLSYRDAVWHDFLAGRPGFDRFELFPVDDERHPTPLGHRYMADMAIHLLQQTYLDSLLYPIDLDEWQIHPAAQVPSPMFTGNYESSNLVCVVGEQLPHAVVHNEGWQWVNEGTAVKPKWGFVSWQVNATLVLKVDTRTAAEQPQPQQQQPRHPPAAAKAAKSAAASTSSPASDAAKDGGSSGNGFKVPNMIVWVGYVKSWRHMGSATFKCIKGCQCQGTTVDALHDLGNTQQHMAKLYATPAKECLIEVKIHPWSRTKDHKFKVTAVMVTHAVEFSGQGDFTDTVLLDTIAPNGAAEKEEASKG